MRTIYRIQLKIIGGEVLEMFEFASTSTPTTKDVIHYLELKKKELLNNDCSACSTDLPEINLIASLIDRIRDRRDIEAHVMPIDLMENGDS